MNKKAHDTVIELFNCAISHDPDVALVGNIRADEIVLMCNRFLDLEKENKKLDHQLHYDFLLDN